MIAMVSWALNPSHSRVPWLIAKHRARYKACRHYLAWIDEEMPCLAVSRCLARSSDTGLGQTAIRHCFERRGHLFEKAVTPDGHQILERLASLGDLLSLSPLDICLRSVTEVTNTTKSVTLKKHSQPSNSSHPRHTFMAIFCFGQEVPLTP
jgi:hypothetical protein